MIYGKTWEPYKGDYEKEEYDIQTADGTTYYNVWPNAGTFHQMLNPEAPTVPEAQVKMIRLAESPTY